MQPRYLYVFCLLVVCTAGAHALLADETPKQSVGYVHYVKTASGDVKEIVFDGEAGWLAGQADPKSHFHNHQQLRRLALVRHPVSVEEMSYISTLANVKELDVGSVTWGLEEDEVTISGEALAQVGRMTWLEELEVSASGFQERHWSFLPKCKSLRILRVGPNITLTDVFFQYVAEVKTLEVLDLRGTGDSFSDDALVKLSELTNLKELRFKSPRVTDDGMKSLARLSELEELWAFGGFTAKSLEGLRPLRKLRDLTIGVEQISRSEMNALAQIKSLRRLRLVNARLGDDEVAALKGHPSLKELYLWSASFTFRSLTTFESLENLEKVSLGRDENSQQIQAAIYERIKERDSTESIEGVK